ncbi:MAG: hypothetical protein QME81_15800, partial [bacterium]|nr:hypothetical protein [bacterium]
RNLQSKIGLVAARGRAKITRDYSISNNGGGAGAGDTPIAIYYGDACDHRVCPIAAGYSIVTPARSRSSYPEPGNSGAICAITVKGYRRPAKIGVNDRCSFSHQINQINPFAYDNFFPVSPRRHMAGVAAVCYIYPCLDSLSGTDITTLIDWT